ncbi:MAG: PmoA family protein [Candidatus Moduliflexus flocculans]|nr:PmoA family protein [Candidatus Moduliflexus flocculans]
METGDPAGVRFEGDAGLGLRPARRHQGLRSRDPQVEAGPGRGQARPERQPHEELPRGRAGPQGPHRPGRGRPPLQLDLHHDPHRHEARPQARLGPGRRAVRRRRRGQPPARLPPPRAMEGLIRGRRRSRSALAVLAGALAFGRSRSCRSSCAAKPHVTFARDDAAGAADRPHRRPRGLRLPLRRRARPAPLLAAAQPERPEHARPKDRALSPSPLVLVRRHRPAGGRRTRDLSFYNALYSRDQDRGPGTTPLPSATGSASSRSRRSKPTDDRAEIVAELVWESDGRPVLDETRRLVVHSLGAGGVPPRPDLDPDPGRTATSPSSATTSTTPGPSSVSTRPGTASTAAASSSDTGATGQEATNMKPALWIDYSNTVDGVTEGVAVFQYPDGREHRWLTREYGCFGPRRPDDRSGKPFTLKDGRIPRPARRRPRPRGRRRLGGRVRERLRKAYA